VDVHLARDVTVVGALRDGWRSSPLWVYSAIRCRTTRSVCRDGGADPRTGRPRSLLARRGQDEGFGAGHLRPRRGARCQHVFSRTPVAAGLVHPCERRGLFHLRQWDPCRRLPLPNSACAALLSWTDFSFRSPCEVKVWCSGRRSRPNMHAQSVRVVRRVPCAMGRRDGSGAARRSMIDSQ
jgi:hypothetical protein